MGTLKKLKYLGRKSLPIRLEMPWLSEPVTIDGEGLCVCPDMDAQALLATNPNMFFDMGEVQPEPEATPGIKEGGHEGPPLDDDVPTSEVPTEMEPEATPEEPKPKTTRKKSTKKE